MGAEVEIIVKPPSMRASREAAAELRRIEPEAVMLNLPESISNLVQDLASENIEYDDFLEKVEERLPSPAEAWLKGYEHLLLELRGLRRGPDIYCYGDMIAFEIEARRAVDIARLTLRAMITGRVDADEWLSLLSEEKRIAEIASIREAEKIVSVLMRYEKAICILEQAPAHLKERLIREGMKPKVRYVGQPYHFTPLEILRRKLAKGGVSTEEVEALVKEHIKFIREYIYRKPLLEALDEWSMNKLYWLHGRRDKS
ncbi:MAG: hypothetical protein QXU12_01195 [Nitrososphaerota archaeon]